MKIAIVGATGLVGQKTIDELNRSKLKNNEFVLYASKNSTRSFEIGKKQYFPKKLSRGILDEKIDYALFCTSEDISMQYIPLLSKNATKCIDFSSAYRHTFPLIVPEINFNTAKGNIICNPNCSTAGAVMALYKINEKFGLKRITYSTYQAASGAGRQGLLDLKQTDEAKLKKFDTLLFDNLIPYIGSIDQNGYSTEENKMIYETKKILNNCKINISATCVRVPVSIGHSIAIEFETKKHTSVEEIKQVIKTANNVIIFDSNTAFPSPRLVRGQKNVLVGRIRNTEHKNTFSMFVCVDNLLKGAAQNAVQILECLVRNDSL